MLEQGLGNDPELPLLKKRKAEPAETLSEIKESLKEILEILDRGDKALSAVRKHTESAADARPRGGVPHS